MILPVSVLALSTAVPPHRLDQDDVARRARRIFAQVFARFPQLDDVFVNAGIAHRYAVCPPDWFEAPQDLRARTQAYLRGATALFMEAAERAIACARIAARDIDIVVTVSSTGIATPSLEARLHGRLGLAPGCRRTPVFGLGCAGGVSGLALAGRLARVEPGRPVLLVVVELCSLAYRPDDQTKASVVATALFGDGAAAAVVVADDGAGGRPLEAQVEQLWPDSLDIMGWRVDPAGFGVILAASLPAFIMERLPPVLAQFSAETGIAGESVDRFACHPGGTKVLQALEATLGVEPGTLDHERGVLADYGNMSAPTVFFVLERVLKAGRHPGRLVMSALGPGFTASFVSLAPPDA
jgi:alkylresorcinol/alkylpyrone synthase